MDRRTLPALPSGFRDYVSQTIQQFCYECYARQHWGNRHSRASELEGDDGALRGVEVIRLKLEDPSWVCSGEADGHDLLSRSGSDERQESSSEQHDYRKLVFS